MADGFDAIAESFAGLLDVSVETAGFILGFATIVVFILAFVIVLATLRVRIEPLVLAIPTAIGISFIGLAEWWPPWAILFIVVVLAVAVAKPFVTGGSNS